MLCIVVKSKYKLLLLDYGGVYSFDYVYSDYEKSITSLFGTHIPEVIKSDFAKIDEALGSARISTTRFIKEVAKLLDAPAVPTASVLEAELLKSTYEPAAPMIRLVKNVKNLGMNVGLLSDICKFQIAYVEYIGGYDQFDEVLLSANAGMTKANPAFYETVLQTFDVTPKEVFFVDDRIEYTKLAASLGFNTLFADKSVYTSADQLANTIWSHLYS